jgi:hypothetical protein
MPHGAMRDPARFVADGPARIHGADPILATRDQIPESAPGMLAL